MMRPAFSMITAIFMIVLLATIGTFILSTAAKTVKSTTYQFQQEQAALYAKSYTELAIMYATANPADSGGNCAEDITGVIGVDPSNGNGYQVQTEIAYIGNGIQCADAAKILNDQTVSIVMAAAPYNPSGLIYMIVDVFVRYKDVDQVAAHGANAPWMTYHKRTLQKL